MLPASNRGAGQNIGFPDVCLTPAAPSPVPVPYPNIAMNAQAAPFSPTVKVSMMSALNMGSMIPMTSGDEAGSASPIKGPGKYTMGNPVVSIDGMPAINLTCPTTGNNMNNPLGAVLVPSATNVFYCHAGAGAAGALDAAELERMGEALEGHPLGPIELSPEGVGRVAVLVFTERLPGLAHAAIERLVAGGARTLVLDLRGNPGGDLDAMLRLAEEFVDEGSELLRVRDADGDELLHRARRGGSCPLPLRLLVDRRTASAAELFAACLQFHRKATVVGERTYGKGFATAVRVAEDGVPLRVPALSFFLPDGTPLDGAGVVPDVVTSAIGSAETSP